MHRKRAGRARETVSWERIYHVAAAHCTPRLAWFEPGSGDERTTTESPVRGAGYGPGGSAVRRAGPAAAVGPLFPAIERLANRSQYRCAFLTDRFRSREEYLKSGREAAFDALTYQPAPG